MAYKKFTKETKEFQMFQEFWTIFQKYGQIENTEEYWKNFTDDARKFAEKYGKYGQELIIATFEEFERKNNIIAVGRQG